MKKAIFAGTFDPFTLGHLSVVKSALNMGFDLTVAVCEKSKSGVDVDSRMEIVSRTVSKENNVKIGSFNGFLTDYMKKNGITILVRGLRNTIDFEYEKNLYYLYKDMMPEIEICYVLTDREKSFVSSSNVREILSLNGDASAYVSSEALSLINNLYGVK